jgi:ubiquinone/menaquinone biosynthesis C-methylase UbiE
LNPETTMPGLWVGSGQFVGGILTSVLRSGKVEHNIRADDWFSELFGPMRDSTSGVVSLFAYAARQLPRLAWYAGHEIVLRRLAAEARQRRKSDRRQVQSSVPLPSQQRLYADMFALLRQDLANVEAGFYPLPHDRDGSLRTLLYRSCLFFDDLPAIHRRRERNEFREVLTENGQRRPDYYLQNFHFQSGGWLTEESADRYDTQVEVLFKGTANAMRRQALPQLFEVFTGRDQRGLRLIDLGCGTGRFLDLVRQTWPRLPSLGIDLSEAYIRHSRRHLKRRSRVNFVVANGESIPVSDNSVDAVTSIFTMHELPPKVRRVVINECERVLKPGGRLILLDSLQTGDVSDYDGLLERFPQNYHEPFYRSYVMEDFPALARDCGLAHRRNVIAFVSKVMVFDKPIAAL